MPKTVRYLAIGDRDDSVVERRAVGNAIRNVPYELLRTRCAALLAGDLAILIFNLLFLSVQLHLCAAPCRVRGICACADRAWAVHDDGGNSAVTDVHQAFDVHRGFDGEGHLQPRTAQSGHEFFEITIRKIFDLHRANDVARSQIF